MDSGNKQMTTKARLTNPIIAQASGDVFQSNGNVPKTRIDHPNTAAPVPQNGRVI
jgi:hypothetical protein